MVEAACHSSAFPPASSLLHCFPLQALTDSALQHTDAIRPPALRSKTHGSSYLCALLSLSRRALSLCGALDIFPPIHFPNGRSWWWDTDIKSITPSGKAIATCKTLDRRLLLQQWWDACSQEKCVLLQKQLERLVWAVRKDAWYYYAQPPLLFIMEQLVN